MTVVISSNRINFGEKSLQDKECILATLNLKAMLFEESNDTHDLSAKPKDESASAIDNNKQYYRIPVITALVHQSNVYFLDQEDRDEPDTDLYLTQPYASGCVFAFSILNSLMCTTYFNDNILMLIRMLVTGGATPELDEQLADEDALRGSVHAQDNVDQRNRCKLARITLCDPRFSQFANGGKYGDLFSKGLREYGILCFGVFRLQDPNKQSKKRFVITNPPASFELNVMDFIMCTVPFYDVETMSTNPYCQMNYSSKFIPLETVAKSSFTAMKPVTLDRSIYSHDYTEQPRLKMEKELAEKRVSTGSVEIKQKKLEYVHERLKSIGAHPGPKEGPMTALLTTVHTYIDELKAKMEPLSSKSKEELVVPVKLREDLDFVEPSKQRSTEEFSRMSLSSPDHPAIITPATAGATTLGTAGTGATTPGAAGTRATTLGAAGTGLTTPGAAGTGATTPGATTPVIAGTRAPTPATTASGTAGATTLGTAVRFTDSTAGTAVAPGTDVKPEATTSGTVGDTTSGTTVKAETTTAGAGTAGKPEATTPGTGGTVTSGTTLKPGVATPGTAGAATPGTAVKLVTTTPGTVAKPVTTTPGTAVKPGATTLGTDVKPVTTTPGTAVKPVTTTPGTDVKPVTTTPGTAVKPVTTTPGTAVKPGATTPGTDVKPVTTTPGTVGAATPGTAVKPVTTTPGTAVKPVTTTPGTDVKPVTTTPGTAVKPVTTTPGTAVKPGATTPGTDVKPVTTTLGTAGAATPGTAVKPVTTTPGTAVKPVTTTPGTDVKPVTTTPGTAVKPVTTTPGTAVKPGATTPGTDVKPVTTTLGTAGAATAVKPVTTTPGTAIKPVTTTPGTAVKPGATTPGTTTPGTDVKPGATTPGTAGAATPGAATPGTSVEPGAATSKAKVERQAEEPNPDAKPDVSK
ncbi:uncharacterized protein LOC144610213 [Rhinoraja longicauda]